MLALILTTALASVPAHAAPVLVAPGPFQGVTLLAGDDSDSTTQKNNGQDGGSKDTDPPKDQPKTSE
ncbi:MAG: hypothetical protein P4L36_10805 [Holophaga sp.]|nr:hypothetical protein [Holophaga sp.]